MAPLTKKQQQELLLAEFLRRLREAPSGTKVYMPVGDLFRNADVVRIDDLRTVREAGDDENDDTTQ